MPNGGRSCHRSCHCSSIHSSIDYMVFAWFFHGFDSIQPRPTLLFHAWPCTARFSWLFKRFWSCLAGDVRPLRSEGNIRQFFGGWFGQVGLEPCWGLPWICLAFTGLDPVVLTGRMTKVAPCAVLVCAATKAFTLLPYPCGCSTSFPFRRFVFALYFASSLRSQIGPPCHIWGKHG